MSLLTKLRVIKDHKHVRYTCVLIAILLIAIILFQYRSPQIHKISFPHFESEVFIRAPSEVKHQGHSPRVTCLVLTSPGNHRDRARHVSATWGAEDEGQDGVAETGVSCPHTIFVTSEPHPNFQHVIYTQHTSYEDLWGKVLDAFRSVNATSSDWFLKADDDTFLIYPRLRELLGRFDSSQPYILGFNLIHSLENGKQTEYMSGGAGYLLSSPAVQMLQNTHHKECHLPGATPYEDVNMGACMAALGVTFGDTRDKLGRPVFLPYPPWTFFDPNLIHHENYLWLHAKSKYPIHFGVQHLSDQVVTFHEIRNPTDLYLFQYFVHHVHLRRASDVTPFVKIKNQNSL